MNSEKVLVLSLLYLRFKSLEILDFGMLCIGNWAICVFVFLRCVSSLIKSFEQKEEQNGMCNDPPRQRQRESTRIVDKQLCTVDEDHHKLNHLHHRQILLPPKVFLHLWSKSGEHIIRVHNLNNESHEEKTSQKYSECVWRPAGTYDMYTRVYESKKCEMLWELMKQV